MAEGLTAAEPAGDPVNSPLAEEPRVVRWVTPAFALCSLILLPWTVYLGYSLPSRQLSADFDVAWAGFDVILLLALAGAGYFALRRSPYLATAATAAATLLVVDAWFDIITSPSLGQRLEAIGLAVIAELPLAALCGWLTYHSQHLAERRIALLLRRSRG